jgi:hypothetical protein
MSPSSGMWPAPRLAPATSPGSLPLSSEPPPTTAPTSATNPKNATTGATAVSAPNVTTAVLPT